MEATLVDFVDPISAWQAYVGEMQICDYTSPIPKHLKDSGKNVEQDCKALRGLLWDDVVEQLSSIVFSEDRTFYLLADYHASIKCNSITMTR